jgi:hypothetical protein
MLVYNLSTTCRKIVEYKNTSISIANVAVEIVEIKPSLSKVQG